MVDREANMNRILHSRWTIAAGFVLLLATAHLATPIIEAKRAAPKGYVLQRGEGESLMGGNLIVKVSPKSGSKSIMVGMQRMPPKFQIPEHTHRQDEVVLVYRGSGTARLDGVSYPVTEGSIVFVPPGAWHGFTASETGMEGVGFLAQSGLEGFFRDLDKASAGGTKDLSIDDLNQIARKYGDVYRASRD
jgi:quercetin dioxygenase-like cupin family protein